MAKIFCIGFQKTGTTSLESALQILGYKVCGVRFDLIGPIRNKEWNKIWEVADAYDAVQDNPWPLLYKELDQHYPGSKFILSVREENDWYKSVLNHFGHTPSQMNEFVYGFPFPEQHKEIYVSTYRKHNEDVKHYFSKRESDLLVIDLMHEASWNSLCAFLQTPVPEIPFPHKNKGAYTSFGKKYKWLMKRIRARLRKWKILPAKDEL